MWHKHKLDQLVAANSIASWNAITISITIIIVNKTLQFSRPLNLLVPCCSESRGPTPLHVLTNVSYEYIVYIFMVETINKTQGSILSLKTAGMQTYGVTTQNEDPKPSGYARSMHVNRSEPNVSATEGHCQLSQQSTELCTHTECACAHIQGMLVNTYRVCLCTHTGVLVLTYRVCL